MSSLRGTALLEIECVKQFQDRDSERDDYEVYSPVAGLGILLAENRRRTIRCRLWKQLLERVERLFYNCKSEHRARRT